VTEVPPLLDPDAGDIEVKAGAGFKATEMEVSNHMNRDVNEAKRQGDMGVDGLLRDQCLRFGGNFQRGMRN